MVALSIATLRPFAKFTVTVAFERLRLVPRSKHRHKYAFLSFVAVGSSIGLVYSVIIRL